MNPWRFYQYQVKVLKLPSAGATVGTPEPHRDLPRPSNDVGMDRSRAAWQVCRPLQAGAWPFTDVAASRYGAPGPKNLFRFPRWHFTILRPSRKWKPLSNPPMRYLGRHPPTSNWQLATSNWPPVIHKLARQPTSLFATAAAGLQFLTAQDHEYEALPLHATMEMCAWASGSSIRPVQYCVPVPEDPFGRRRLSQSTQEQSAGRPLSPRYLLSHNLPCPSLTNLLAGSDWVKEGRKGGAARCEISETLFGRRRSYSDPTSVSTPLPYPPVAPKRSPKPDKENLDRLAWPRADGPASTGCVQIRTPRCQWAPVLVSSNSA